MRKRTFKLDKLVRDNIVQLHLDMGGEVDWETLKGEKLTNALIQKLIEEAKELKRSGDFSVSEIVDLKEIIERLAKNLKITDQELSKTQKSKRNKNGAFEKGHYIHTVTLPADHKWAKYYAAEPKRFPEIKK